MSRARDFADLAGSADAGGITGRNLIINGSQIVSQRNGTSSTTPGNFAYLTDRFQFRATQGSKFNAEQSTTAATGFKNSLKMTVASAYTVTSSDQFGVRQFIEGQNISHLEWGTANAKSVTLSFSVRSSVTGTHSGALGNSGDARAYPFSFTVSSADTWEQKTITIPGDTSGTWLDTNGIGIKVNFNLGAGSNHLAAAESWTSGEIVGATGSVSVVGTASATLYITGIQLEVGQATPFEHEPFGVTLQKAMRYYEKSYDYATAPGTGIAYPGNLPLTIRGMDEETSGQRYFVDNLKVEKRAAPTNTYYDEQGNTGKVTTYDSAGTGTHNVSIGLVVTESSKYGAGPGNSAIWGFGFYYECDAEL